MRGLATIGLSLSSLALIMACAGCHRRIGEPDDRNELMRPDEVVAFDRLYSQNCSACHGENGSGGPAFDLSNPTYQLLIDDASLRRWINSGMPGTQMPAFGESAGGLLTEPQIDALVSGMRARWTSEKTAETGMPSYFAHTEGDVSRGEALFRATCVLCHQQGEQEITDASYLALVSDQSLRTVVIAGRPDLGHPDWKQVRPGRPVTEQNVSDIVAYLHSLRSETPGQPYPEEGVKR
jgi:cytochrome c oxidase cbb3-type subunit III